MIREQDFLHLQHHSLLFLLTWIIFSVANGGLFPAKWLILKIFGGQKKWLISHQNVAYFQPFKWLILSHQIAANCGLNVAYFCNLRQFCEIFLPAAANFKDYLPAKDYAEFTNREFC